MTIKEFENDWRNRGQMKYLYGVTLYYKRFSSKIREHDHCEFCFSKFSDYASDLHQGYATENNYYWVCEECFNDLKILFKWKLNNFN